MDIQNTDACIIFRPTSDSEEVLRIDADGFHYAGRVVKDAGEAHQLITEWFTKNGHIRVAELEKENANLKAELREAQEDLGDAALAGHMMGVESVKESMKVRLERAHKDARDAEAQAAKLAEALEEEQKALKAQGLDLLESSRKTLAAYKEGE